jgi:hypothetical protein
MRVHTSVVSLSSTILTAIVTRCKCTQYICCGIGSELLENMGATGEECSYDNKDSFSTDFILMAYNLKLLE